MRNLVFETYNDMVEYMIELNDKNLMASAIAYLDEATELIRCFMMYDVSIGSLEISQDYIDGYSGEYLISVVNSELFVEKAFNVDKQEYIHAYSDVVLLCDGCDHEYDDCTVCYHYVVSDDERCCDEHDDCEDCDECCECCNDDIHAYRLIDDDGNVIGMAYIAVDIGIED